MSDTIWLLAKSDYDDFTIIGLYTSEALANAERERVEALEIEYGDRARRLSERRGDYVISTYTVNTTGTEFIVRVRADGVADQTIFSVGYSHVYSNYEPTYEGRAASVEEARAKALASRPVVSAPVPQTQDEQ